MRKDHNRFGRWNYAESSGVAMAATSSQKCAADWRTRKKPSRSGALAR